MRTLCLGSWRLTSQLQSQPPGPPAWSIDNTGPVLGQPGQFAEVRVPYEELRAALVHKT